MTSKPGSKRAITVFLFISAFVGCKTPLKEVVSADAPGFRVKRPARGDHELGRFVENGQAVAQTCFQGTMNETPFNSWTSRTLEYNGDVKGDISTDFGGTVKTRGSAELSRTMKVTLGNVGVVALNDLYAVGCGLLTQGDDGAGSYSVITQALIATSIDMQQDGANNLELEVDTTVVGGTLTLDTGQKESWTGANLYFADLLQNYRVDRVHARQKMGVGQTLDIGTCGFTLRAVDSAANSWTGSVSCGATGSADLSGSTGQYLTGLIAGGWSISARVTDPGLSEGTVDIYRFVVTPG